MGLDGLRDEGVRITTREIYDEVRQIHETLDGVKNRMDDVLHWRDNHEMENRLQKSRFDELDKRVAVYAALASVFGSVLTMIASKTILK